MKLTEVNYAIFDRKSGVVKASPNWTNTLGHKASLLEDVEFLMDIIHEKDFKRNISAYFKLEVGKVLTNQTTRLRKENGNYVTMSWEVWKTTEGTAYFTAWDGEWMKEAGLTEPEEHGERLNFNFESDLTDTESRILKLFMRSGGKPIDRGTLLKEVYFSTKVQPHTINVHICNLRKKIETRGLKILKDSRDNWIFQSLGRDPIESMTGPLKGFQATLSAGSIWFALNKLRDPIATMSCASELLNSSKQDPESIAVLERLLRKQENLLNTQMTDIIDMASFAQTGFALENKAFDVPHVLEKSLKKVKHLFQQKDQSPLLDIGASELTALGDPSRLTRVLEGVLAFVSSQAQSKGLIELKCREENNRNLILIDFEAVEELSIEKIQACPSLGYSLIKSLLNVNFGEIVFFKKEVGKGSCFKISLPKSSGVQQDPDIDKGPSAGELPMELSCPGKRILVVDDNIDLVETLSNILSLKGYIVDATTSGKKALTMAKTNNPDVAIIDLAMPEMDGFEVASKLRRFDPLKEIRLIAFSCFLEKEYGEKAKQAGFDHYISKPLQLKDLLATL